MLKSFPSWERGLKQTIIRMDIESGLVVPLVGTWIETTRITSLISFFCVVPLVGTWLETACQLSLKMIQYIIPLAEI